MQLTATTFYVLVDLCNAAPNRCWKKKVTSITSSTQIRHCMLQYIAVGYSRIYFFFSRTQLAFSKLVISAYCRHLSSTECVQLKTFYALLTAFFEGEYLFNCNRHLSSIENTASSSSRTNTQIYTFQIYQWTCTVRTMKKKKRLEHGSTRWRRKKLLRLQALSNYR
jgi:hypothetical protein